MPDNHLKFHSSNGKRRILVIEDELINRELLGFLIGDEYELLNAETGEEALKLIDSESRTISLVLLDLNLPDMKGIDILRRMKADSNTALIPVIVMTADQDAEVECLTLGAIDFIPKPYPKREVILARILRTIELSEDRDIIRYTERDQLTGLYNREYFYRYAAQFDTYHEDTATDAVVLDINHFHMLNERYGKAYGDEVLKKMTDILLETVREEGGIVCRKEADNFLIYCPHRNDYEEILKKASLIMGEENPLRVRIGVYSKADHSIDIERRFDRAKLAADSVKDSYSDAIGLYDNSMHEKELYTERLIDEFHTAIRDEQFSVYFQPKFDVRGKEPVLNSAEALVRWKHPELGMISPGVFVPLFEKNGLIREVDSYVWRKTAEKIALWKKTLGKSIPVSVNISRIDLYDPKLPETLDSIVETFDLSYDELLLEITESAYTENADQIIKVINGLREKGFHIEMDDFGAGYSSLNMISVLPIDTLKLDMQFVRTAFRERKDTRLLEAIIGLAKSLGLPTIAEGVETAEQMFTLKAMGCDIIQGYYFSRPLPADEFEAYVKALDSEQNADDVSALKAGKDGPKDKFTYEALHDPLTGLYNHSAFDILFHDSDQEHIAVMIANVNEYGAVLKKDGRQAADQMILKVSDVLKNSFRSADHICRLQEDEFVVIMSRMTSGMQNLAYEKVEQMNCELAKEEPVISLIVGIAFSDRDNPQGDVFEDADLALKRIKEMRKTGCFIYE